MSNPITLLSDNDLIVVCKPLTKALGMEKSILITQIAERCDVTADMGDMNNSFHLGKWWLRMSLKQWQRAVDLFNAETIQNALQELETMNLILVDNFNQFGTITNAKWYSVNEAGYSAFINLWHQHDKPICNDANQSEAYLQFETAWAVVKHQYTDIEIRSHSDYMLP